MKMAKANTVDVAVQKPRQETVDEISPQDFALIKDLRTKNAFVASRAEKAILESRLSELEYKNTVLNIYVKYGLSLKDSIDESTGKILRNSSQEERGHNENG